MNNTLSLRTAAKAFGIASALLVGGNLILYLIVFVPRFQAAPPVTTAPAQLTAQPTAQSTAQSTVQASAAVARATSANLLADTGIWLPVDGAWEMTPEKVTQTRADGFDHRAVYAQPFEQPHIRLTFQHQRGAGAGLLFNMPTREALAGAYLVRYLNARTLIWGYFDDQGAFVSQGTGGVGDPGTALHTLEINASATAYHITLDGVPVAGDVPLERAGGYVAITTSESAAVFQALVIESVVSAASSTFELLPLSGDWALNGDVFTQRSQDSVDSIAGVGLQGGAFTVRVEVRLPPADSAPKAGGGLIVHMAGDRNPAGGNLVRFHNGGRAILWGHFDANGAFSYEGEAALSLDTTRPHTLTLAVNESTYDVQVDEVVVKAGLPLFSPAGWVGLLSYGGPVTFAQLSFAQE